MTDTTTSTENVVSQWDSDYFEEYVRQNLYAPYMGTSENSAIQVDEELTKVPGDNITISLIGRLTGANAGEGVLEGNEEALGNYGHAVNIEPIRNAVLVNNWQEDISAIDLRNGAKTQLQNWSMDLLKDDISEALHSRASGVSTMTNYGDAAATLHDSWDADNADRLLFAAGNAASGDFTADLLLQTPTDIMSASILSLARRRARTADPRIRPIRINGAEEWFVYFCDPYMFRDLKNDTTIQAAQREAWTRGQNNPLFRAGDIIYDGVIAREIPEMADFIDDAAGSWGAGATADNLAIAGSTGGRVGVGFLCGAQAAAVAWGKRTQSTTDTRDYGFRNGVGVEEFRGVEKLVYQDNEAGSSTNRVDHGVVTVYAAAAKD